MDFSLLDWLTRNEIPILGILLAIIFYLKRKKVKSPCYAIRSYNIIRDLDSRIGKLEILYSGKRIENFTVTKIAFWNAGNETINKENIASANPLAINVAKEYKILDIKILKIIESANQFEINIIDDRSIGICFDYLDKNQGAIIEVLHTGISEKDISIQGKIKGVGEPIRKSARRSRDSISLFDLVIMYGSSIFFFLLPIWSIANNLIEYMNGNIYEIIFRILFFSILIPFCWGIPYYLLLRQTLLPKGFKIFFD